MTPARILAQPALLEVIDNDGGDLTICHTRLRVVPVKRYSTHGFDAVPVAFAAEQKD